MGNYTILCVTICMQIQVTNRGQTLTRSLAPETTGVEGIILFDTISYICVISIRHDSSFCPKSKSNICGLRYASFILPQRSLIEGRLASTDRNTSNVHGSAAIRESTAASIFEVLTPVSCIM